MDLSVLIPARNEQFLARTIQDVLANLRGDTEIIAVCDGNWPWPATPDHPRVHLIHHSKPVGQRAATNEAARMSTAKYIMKLDAHCAVEEGFDIKLMADCEQDWTVIPRMYNLHAFDWQCVGCGSLAYQGPKPVVCGMCQNDRFEQVVVWKPRISRRTDFARFDRDLHFQYWRAYEKRPEAQGEIADVMCFVGAAFFMHRQRFYELGLLDEDHGSWGQMGVEISCKSWLSGGRQVVNKKTWFAHMFRTREGFSFPYPITAQEQEQAREHSRQLWMANNWSGAVHPLRWLIDKFAPVPEWDKTQKGIVYYSDSRLDPLIDRAVKKQLEKIAGEQIPVTAVTLVTAAKFGREIVFPMQRGYLTMFRQILAGLEACEADIVFLCEHDVLYHPSHFDFVPPKKDVFYYNENVYKVEYPSGRAIFYYVKQTSGLCAYRDLLLEHYRKRVQLVEKHGFSRKMGFEPGTHSRSERVDDHKAESWMSEYPNIDIRHNKNLTPSRWSKDQFRDQRYTRGWTEVTEVPGWGVVQHRIGEILESI